MSGLVSTGMGECVWVQFLVLDIYLGMYQPPRSTQPGHPFVAGTESTSQMVVMPSGWGVRAGVVRVWVTGKTV